MDPHQPGESRLVLPRESGQVCVPQEVGAVVMVCAMIDEDARLVEFCSPGQEASMPVDGQSPAVPCLVEEAERGHPNPLGMGAVHAVPHGQAGDRVVPDVGLVQAAKKVEKNALSERFSSFSF